MSNIILTGFMGTGKSSVGKLLAQKTGYVYCDLDAVIVGQVGLSINDIFAKYGEAYFRELEADAIKQVSSADKQVVATGGGAVIRADNRKLLRKSGIIVNLEASVEEICTRLSNDSERPLLNDRKSVEKVTELLEQREQYYADADIRIDTNGKKVEDVVREILCHLKGKFGFGNT
jgi:shikimate kinase